ncbi:hypothetical protein GJ496_002699 [Pomphorhynchus laevis]|nr:hypothetical protein GJ496_002699 [Pomphorhynchus laevis]
MFPKVAWQLVLFSQRLLQFSSSYLAERHLILSKIFAEMTKSMKLKRRKLLRNVTQEDRKHLEQFGQQHPVYDIVDNQPNSFDIQEDTNEKRLSPSEVVQAETWSDPYKELLTNLSHFSEHEDEDDDNLSFMESLTHKTEGAQQFSSNESSISSDNDDAFSSDGDDSQIIVDTNKDYYLSQYGSESIIQPLFNKSSYMYEQCTAIEDWKNAYTLRLFKPKSYPNTSLDDEHTSWRLDSKTMSKQSIYLFSLMCRYNDLCWQIECPWRDRIASYGTHCLNHVLRTRRVIANGNKRVRNTDIEVRDQGFTRPAVLVLVPFREDVRLFVSWLVHTTKAKGQDSVGQREKFELEFGAITMKQQCTDQSLKRFKPELFHELFQGCTDDHFRLGICVNRNSVKLFVPFYKADIIIASPLGIRTMTQGKDATKELDFLSSIEITVIDRAHVIFMQNWLHLIFVIESLNRIPSKPRNTDFSRVKSWYLDGKAKFYRQTILMADFYSAYFKSLFSHCCCNHSGRIESYMYANPKGHLDKLPNTMMPVRYLFERIPSDQGKSVVDCPNIRVRYFQESVLPKLIKETSDLSVDLNSRSNVLIFVPSYFDYIRLRNMMKTSQNTGFLTLCEHTSDKLISRHRRLFFNKRVAMMLMTERFHFYRRYRIRGVRHLIFYELPFCETFFADLCNTMLSDDPKCTFPFRQCTVLYDRHDLDKLCTIVGEAKAISMIKAQSSVQCLHQTV